MLHRYRFDGIGYTTGFLSHIHDEIAGYQAGANFSRRAKQYSLVNVSYRCAGIATRAGCGALCPSVNLGCRGCYGPADGVVDTGARLISAIASVIDANTPEEIDAVLDTLPDPAGYFYRFGLPQSLLRRTRLEGADAAPVEEVPRLDPSLKD